MSTEAEVVTLNIQIKDASASQEGFGVPLIAAVHTLWPERVRTFEELTDLTDPPLSVPVTHPVYVIARAIKSQQPSPTTFKVGKRLGKSTQVVVLTLSAPAAVGDVYRINVDGELVSFAATTTVLADATDGLGTLISGRPGLAAVDGPTIITVTASVAGTRHSLEPLSANITANETSVAATVSIETDLAAIRAADAEWYALYLDTTAQPDLLAAAAWAETQRVLLFATIGDANAAEPVPGGEGGGEAVDVGSALQAAGYHRTISLFHGRPATQAAAAAWLGRMLPKPPGSANWANKSLAGVDMSVLTPSQRTILRSRNVNYYVAVKGLGFTLDGRAASGRYADITHGMDWFDARTQERVIGLLANTDKVAYTDKGMDLIRAQVVAQVLEGISAEVIDGAEPWAVTVPLVAAVNPNDKIARTVQGVRFNFVLQGAVNKVAIAGTVLIAAAAAA